jgi:GMP synthase-like glutamine amidotransferase
MMRIHVFQHVPYEDAAFIAEWASNRGHDLSVTRFFEQPAFPSPGDFDWLVILGGPMGAMDDEAFPWLADERACIRQAIDAGKTVLGICLGAQIIAAVLGARVFRNAFREIGWYPVTFTMEGRRNGLFNSFPPIQQVFHWHSDTFELPEGATLIARSDASKNQAFVYGERVVGIQFHCELSADSVRLLIENCGNQIDNTPWVQRAEELLRHVDMVPRLNAFMESFLNRLENL